MGYSTVNSATTRLLAAVLLAGLLAWAGQAEAILAPASPLNAAPADAALIAYSPSLAQLSEHAALLNAAVGAPPSPLADVVGLFKTQTGLVNGLDEAGPVMFVLPTVDAGEQRTILMVVPVADYEALVGNIGGDATAAVASGPISATGQMGYIKRLGDDGRFAVMGLDEQVVTDYTPDGDAAAQIHQRLGQLGVTYLNKTDLAFLLNVEDHREAIKRGLDEGLADARAKAAESGDPMAVKMLDLYGQMLTSFLRDAQGVMVSLDIVTEGVGLSFTAQMQPDSVWGELMTASAGAGEGDDAGDVDLAHLLSRVPGDDYLLALAIDHQALHLRDLLDQLVAVLEEGGEAGQEDTQAGEPGQADWLVDIFKLSMSSTRHVKAQAATYAMPPAGMVGMAAGLKVIGIIQVDDADAYLSEVQKGFEAMNQLRIPLPVPGASTSSGPMAPDESQETDEPGEQDAAADMESPAESPAQTHPQALRPYITFHTTFTPEAAEIDGVKLASYSTMMQLPPEMTGQMGPLEMMVTMGTGNTQGYIAARGDYVLTTTTLDLEAVRQALALIDSGEGVGTQTQLQQVRDVGLPADASVQMYLNVNSVVNALNTFLGMMGMPPAELPADLPPVAFGAATAEGGLVKRLYLPMPTITAVAEAAMTMQGRMMQHDSSSGDEPQSPPF